jgi:hypothetical protein
MTGVVVSHTKTDTIADWTQVDVDAQIVAGNLPPGTLLADIVLPSDWNANHTLVGMDELVSNIRDYVIIDMGGGNYTMTDAEAVAYLKIITNEGVGSTLYWPTTSDGYTSIDQQISMQYTANPIIIASQTGGDTDTLAAGSIGSTAVSYIPGVAAKSKNKADGVYYRAGTNGVNVQTVDYTAVADDAGKLIVFTAGSTLTINAAATTNYGTNAVIRVLNLQSGGGYILISPAVGVSISGHTQAYQDCILELQRNGDTNNWYCSTVNNDLLGTTDGTATVGTLYPLWVSVKDTTTEVHTDDRFTIDGATGILTTNGQRLADTTVASSDAAGLTFFSFDQQGFSVPHYTDDTGAQLELCRDNLTIVKNTSGGSISKGEVVYITGSTGNVANVSKAKSDSATTMPCLGFMFETTADNSFGRVLFSGVLESVNTSAYLTGDILYISSATAGGITKTKPVYPNYAQEIGRVLVSGVGNGSIQVYQGTQNLADPELTMTKKTITADFIIPSGYSVYVAGGFEIPSGFSLEIGATATFEIG